MSKPSAPELVGFSGGLGCKALALERWYCVSRDGMATLCTCEGDAKIEAANAAKNYPRSGPYLAVQLVNASTVASERAAAEQAMKVLRQIAEMPRRTREQRLANACVTFLDALGA